LLVARNGYEREIHALAYYVPGFQDGLVRWIQQVPPRILRSGTLRTSPRAL
jgi:hypothetical protein